MGGPVFERQRHSGRPHPAHPDPEQGAQREEHAVGIREAAEKREQRIPEDGEEQRRLAAPPVGGGARSHAAEHAADQRDAAERARQRLADREAALNVDQQEGQDREVERVEHPPEVGRGERAPLRRRDFPVPRRRRALGLRRHRWRHRVGCDEGGTSPFMRR